MRYQLKTVFRTAASGAKHGTSSPGQKWNLLNIAGKVSSFHTLVGSYAAKLGTPETASMSVHVWKLQEGQTDTQLPHAEEEFYYVLSGRRTLVLSRGTEHQKSVDVEVGDLIYVPAHTEHTSTEAMKSCFS